MTDLDLGGSLDGWDDELNDWTEDDRVRDQRIEAARHQRSVCCPDDPTCPWPDSCAECGEDWPCTAIGEARERAMSHLPQTDAKLEQQAAAEFDAAKAHIAGYLTDDKPRPVAETTPDLMAPLVESMRLAAERRSHHDD